MLGTTPTALLLPYVDAGPAAARPLQTPDARPPVALSNSFGFGGHNATLLEAA